MTADPDTSVFFEPPDVRTQLVRLGVDEDILRRAIERNWYAYASCTRNHQPAIPGIWAWGETICSLGEQLVPTGWRRVNESMWPLIVNKENTIAISAATGNENTGNKDEDPLTSSSKGPRTADAITSNRRQLVLFPEILEPMQSPNASLRTAWLLLIYRDISARQLRAELSSPISMTSDGRVNGWARRIILAPIQLDEIPANLLDGADGPQSPEITVEIRRRG